MNPFNYLHLPNAEVDIRGSCIAISFSLDVESSSFTNIAFNMMHGGRPKAVEEPQKRITEAIQNWSGSPRQLGRGCFVHLIYPTSAARWWTNTQSMPESVSTNINRALHSIAAHLHRYRSELKSIEGFIVDLATHYAAVCERGLDDSADRASRGFSQVLSQMRATNDFAQELEKKIQNIRVIRSFLTASRSPMIDSRSRTGRL